MIIQKTIYKSTLQKNLKGKIEINLEPVMGVPLIWLKVHSYRKRERSLNFYRYDAHPFFF